MHVAFFRFYGELNFFLPRQRKNSMIEHLFDWRASIKDMVESLGVPHTEVDLLVVNEASVDFNYIVQPHDWVNIYPAQAAAAVEPKVPLRPPYPGRFAFVLDQHLGRLAAYLRMMGFDTLYRNDYDDEELAQVSHDENRILLTRDVGLLKRSLVVYGYYVRETNREKQLAEITRRFDLLPMMDMFKHCMKCNGLLSPVSKEEILDLLPSRTGEIYDHFHRCELCKRIYWKGPHYQQMRGLMLRILSNHPAPDQSSPDKLL